MNSDDNNKNNQEKLHSETKSSSVKSNKSNYDANRLRGLIPFKKKEDNDGVIDPRININGKPRSFEQLRALFQEIANEEIEVGKGKNKKKKTRIRNIGEIMAGDKKLFDKYLEFTYGKVPQAVQVKGDINVNWRAFIESDQNPDEQQSTESEDTDTEADSKQS